MVAQEAAGAKSQIISQFQQQAEQLLQFVGQAAVEGISMHEVERGVFDSLLKMGHLAVKQFLHLQGNGDLGETITLPDGKQVKRLEQSHTRSYLSIFGLFEIERHVYGLGEGKKIDFVPLDTRLSLPESKFSYVLQDWDQMASTEEPYNEVSAFLQRILGLKQYTDSLERMSRNMTEDAESFCWSREKPPAKEEGELLVQTADGKGVPIRRAADAAVIEDHQHQSGPKPDRKKMATIGSVYTVDRFVRTPEQVLDALFRKPGDPRPDWERPKPCHKRVYASLNYENAEGDPIDGEAAVFGWIAEQVKLRDPKGIKETVCIMDGQKSLWNTKDCLQERVNMTELLDLLHVTPRVWKLAHIFCASNERQREQFVRGRVYRILQGKVAGVVRGIRQLTTRRRLAASARRKVETICSYFESNQDRMRYDVYLKRGYPIASGVIEGACCHVIKDRMERTGMSWTIPGAQAMLLLRAIFTTDQWGEFLQYRVERENKRLYPHRTILEQVDWPIAA